MLPLMEPLIGVNFALFPPYGSSGQLNGENRLSGSFGSATLDGVSDYYSQLVYKVPMAKQKLKHTLLWSLEGRLELSILCILK